MTNFLPKIFSTLKDGSGLGVQQVGCHTVSTASRVEGLQLADDQSLIKVDFEFGGSRSSSASVAQHTSSLWGCGADLNSIS